MVLKCRFEGVSPAAFPPEMGLGHSPWPLSEPAWPVFLFILFICFFGKRATVERPRLRSRPGAPPTPFFLNWPVLILPLTLFSSRQHLQGPCLQIALFPTPPGLVQLGSHLPFSLWHSGWKILENLGLFWREKRWWEK